MATVKNAQLLITYLCPVKSNAVFKRLIVTMRAKERSAQREQPPNISLAIVQAESNDGNIICKQVLRPDLQAPHIAFY